MIRIKKWWLFALYFSTIIFSCSKPSEKTTPDYDINLNNYLKEFCGTEHKETVDYLKKHKLRNVDLLISFYQKRNCQSVWVNNKQTTPLFKNALSLLRSSMNFGLDTILYSPNVISDAALHMTKKEFSTRANLNAVAVEIITTHSLLCLLENIKTGLFLPDSAIYEKMAIVSNDSIPIFLDHAIKSNDLSVAVQAASPKNPHYRTIQKALTEYLAKNRITNEKYPVPYFAKDSSGCKTGIRKMLAIHGYLDKKDLESSIEESKVIGALVKFQTDFGLRNRGRYDTITVETIRNSTFDLYRKACITLQRIRWSNISDKNYLLINIPSFTLNLVEEGEIALTHKIVCGKPDHETPELNSRISHFNLFPEWNVPHKISTKELLPQIQANPKYLEKHNYEIINGKNEVVDPSKLKWKKFSEKNFPYRIRQSSGDGNSLGIIKFYFNNSYGVYLHDTPSKSLFNLNYRAFSHGCMRVQNPFDFAKALLEFNKGMLHLSEQKMKEMNKYESQRKFDKYRKNKEVLPEVKEMNEDVVNVKKSTFNMKRPLPIYVRYFTAFVDEKSNLRFYSDLYHKDTALVEKFNLVVKSNTPF